MPVELSIVIPAYREAAKIAADIDAAGRFLADCFPDRNQLIVVDDGSPDDTAARARDALGALPDTVAGQLVTAARNRGKGAALRLGVAATTGRRVLFADAGGCVPYADARSGLALLDRTDANIAHGSRRTADSRIVRPQPLYRRIGSRVFRTLIGVTLGIPPHLRDTQCGFKLYEGNLARRLFAECFTDGFMFDIELIRRARRHGVVIREFPVRWSSDDDTRYAPVRGSWRNARELARIRWRA